MPRQIIIDTDPGQDDALAILLALACPEELEVLGVVTVAGNVPLPLTTRNARALVELAQRPEVPVFAGCPRPLMRSLVTAEHVHGKTGLDGWDVPDPQVPLQEEHGVDWMIRTLRQAEDDSVTLCTLAPLTNVGMAFAKAPDILPKIREIVMMGGAYFEGGNITPSAEFNIYVDPHAAQTVFSCGRPLTVMPLDVTHQALMPRPWIQSLAELGTPVGLASAGMLGFYERYDVEKYGSSGGPLHDPTVIAYLLQPELFSGKFVNVTVETHSELTMGMTVMDWWKVTQRVPNATVMNRLDAEGFFQLLRERLARL
ncbi:MAG: nucleoside hydrolase [bacterium]